MFVILYLPTGEHIRHRIYNMVLKLPYRYDAELWVSNNRSYMKTDTVSYIERSHLLEIVEVDDKCML
jgi:hypothetical protein